MKRNLFLAALLALSLGTFSSCKNEAGSSTSSTENKTTDAKPEKFETPYLEEVKGLTPSTHSFAENGNFVNEKDIYVKIADGKIYHWEFTRSIKDKTYSSVAKHEVPVSLIANEDLSAHEFASNPLGSRENIYSVSLTLREPIAFASISAKGKVSGKTSLVDVIFADKTIAEAFVAQLVALRKPQ